MCYLEAKKERKSNGSQNTNSSKKCLSIEIQSAAEAIKEQNWVNDHEVFEFGWFPSAFGRWEEEFG